MKSYKLINYIVVAIWFSLFILLVYGSGAGLHYKVAPYLVGVSFLIIAFSYSKSTKVIKILDAFAILTICTSYHYFDIEFETEFDYTYLEYLCYSISGYCVAKVSYVFVMRNYCKINYFYYLIVLFYLIGIVRFFRASSQLEYLYANTAFYYILMPLPLLLLKTEKKILLSSYLFTSSILCVLSVKRSAIIAIFIIWIEYILIAAVKSKKRLIQIIVISIVGFFCINYFLQGTDFVSYTDRLSERFLTMDEDKGSGRGDIIFQFFTDDVTDIIQFPEFLIGNGFEGIYHKYKYLSSAHNDFLEVTYSLGIIGLLLLLRLFYYIIKNLVFLWRMKSRYTLSYVVLASLFILYSLVGCNFNYFYLSLPLFMSIGVLEAINKKYLTKG